MNNIQHLLQYKIISIIRGVQPGDVPPIVEALYEGGIRSLEITLNSPKALQLIEQLSVNMDGKMLIGAGTVLTAAEASDAIGAGAKFIISPIVDFGTIQVTKENGVISIPGAFTPTEIYMAYTSGADIIKVFPASIGPEYIKDIQGPLPHIPIMPTGGVHLGNIQGFLKAGAAAFGIGSALVNAKEKAGDDYLRQLTAMAKKFIDAVTIKEEVSK